MNNRSKKRIEYSIKDIEKLQDLYFQNYTAEEIAKELKRTTKAIQERISYLKLPKEKQYHWTEKECQFLKNNFKKISTPELAKMLNRSVNSVYKKYERLSKELNDLKSEETETIKYKK